MMTPITQTVRLPPMPRDTRHVECLDSLSGLTGLGPQWNALLHDSAADGPFLTWEWLHAWWTHLHGAATLKVLVVRDGSTLIAIAPFMVNVGAVPGFSRLELLGTGHAGSDYLDVIVRIGHESDAVRAIARFLGTQNMALRLGHLPDVSLGARLADALVAEGWVASAAEDGTCPIITLAGHSWDSYLATLGSAHRANVRRRLRALDRQFQVRFERVASESQRVAALEALVGFHDTRYRTDGGSTAFRTPALRAFQDAATRRALDRGWLRMYVLRLDGEAAAVMYGFSYNRAFYFYQHGFDDRYKHYSVGLALMAQTIRAALEEGALSFDLLWGTESYKWLWTREARPLRRIDLFPPHVAGRIHRRAVDARKRLGTLVRSVRLRGDHRVSSA